MFAKISLTLTAIKQLVNYKIFRKPHKINYQAYKTWFEFDLKGCPQQKPRRSFAEIRLSCSQYFSDYLLSWNLTYFYCCILNYLLFFCDAERAFLYCYDWLTHK